MFAVVTVDDDDDEDEAATVNDDDDDDDGGIGIIDIDGILLRKFAAVFRAAADD